MGKRTMKLATRGKRFGAAVIDTAIPLVCYITIMIAGIAASARSVTGPGYGYGFEEDFGYGYGYGYGYEVHTNPGWFPALIGILCLVMLAYAVVECVFFAKSKTIGKAILGMQVVSSTDGRPVGFWKMLFREVIVKQASNVFLLGYIWILIDERNRGWHDKILDTYVVDLKESANLNVPIGSAPAEASSEPPAETPAPAASQVSEEPEEIVAEIELTPVPAEALEMDAPAEAVAEEEVAAEPAPEPEASATPLPKKPVIRLDVDEDE